MSSSNGIMYREAISHLTNGVGISLRLSLSLAIDTIAIAKTMAIGDTCDDTNIVRTARGIGIVYREPKSNLSNGVCIAVSLPLAIEGPVTNSSKASHMSIAIVNTCNNPTIGSTIGDLA